MYILRIGSEFLPTTVRVDYIAFCSQLFLLYRKYIKAGKDLILRKRTKVQQKHTKRALSEPLAMFRVLADYNPDNLSSARLHVFKKYADIRFIISRMAQF